MVGVGWGTGRGWWPVVAELGWLKGGQSRGYCGWPLTDLFPGVRLHVLLFWVCASFQSVTSVVGGVAVVEGRGLWVYQATNVINSTCTLWR